MGRWDGNTGDNHANFKLSNLGEQLILSNNDSTVIDAEFIYPQLDDIAYARSPNGTGSFSMLAPTFNGSNTPTSIENLFEDDNILFSEILQNRDILGKKPQSIEDLFILLEIVFRIKDIDSKGIDSKDIRYFLPFDLLYHKLK